MREKVEKELREKRQAQAAAAAAKKHDDDEESSRKPVSTRGPSVMGAAMPVKTRMPAPSSVADDDDDVSSGGTLTKQLPPGGGPSAAMAAMASARVASRAAGKAVQKPPGHCPECDCTPAAFEPNKFVKYNCKVCYHTHVGSPELDKKIAKAGGAPAAGAAGGGASGAAANKCSSCKCTNFQPNPFKKKVCNSCFHQHQED